MALYAKEVVVVVVVASVVVVQCVLGEKEGECSDMQLLH